MVTAPFFLTLLVAGMLINFVQVGRLASWKAIKPDLTRINPISGFQRFFSSRQFVEVGKGLLKIFVIIFVAYQVLAERLAPISAALTTPTDSLGLVLADTAWTIAWRCVWVLVFIGAADYAYQRYEYMESLKMTKQEVEDETKQAEVPREVKSKMKERQYQQARSRMMQEIPKASVVITNPTHLAIALKYERKEEEVPLVVAKGADKLAEKIKEIARENKVPIVENVPVARALYKDVEVGDEIPRELYATVAEILVMVTKLNKRRSRV
jgi:flagellar biosynthetic protein FlhB